MAENNEIQKPGINLTEHIKNAAKSVVTGAHAVVKAPTLLKNTREQVVNEVSKLVRENAMIGAVDAIADASDVTGGTVIVDKLLGAKGADMSVGEYLNTYKHYRQTPPQTPEETAQRNISRSMIFLATQQAGLTPNVSQLRMMGDETGKAVWDIALTPERLTWSEERLGQEIETKINGRLQQAAPAIDRVGSHTIGEINGNLSTISSLARRGDVDLFSTLASLTASNAISNPTSRKLLGLKDNQPAPAAEATPPPPPKSGAYEKIGMEYLSQQGAFDWKPAPYTPGVVVNDALNADTGNTGGLGPRSRR